VTVPAKKEPTKEELMKGGSGWIIKYMRNDAKMAQRQFAVATGIQQSRISLIENGSCRPSSAEIGKIFDVFESNASEERRAV
jgi:transcriptional regulator with XRE-family HTH domain